MDIEVPIRRGSSAREKADLVIYDTQQPLRRDQNQDIWGIVETKKPGELSGIAQLKTYMSATSARWGVWTNGNNILFFGKRPGDARILDNYLNNIPSRGQRVREVGMFTKQDLRPYGRYELKAAFRRILNTLYANTNISRREKLGNEMIKLIFAKIRDETTYLDRPPDFRAAAGENPDTVKGRISDLFKAVVRDLSPEGLFDPNDTITLDAKGVAWVAGQLERGSLIQTDSDVVGDAFEVFAESKLVGEKGEFFTPRAS